MLFLSRKLVSPIQYPINVLLRNNASLFGSALTTYVSTLYQLQLHDWLTMTEKTNSTKSGSSLPKPEFPN